MVWKRRVVGGALVIALGVVATWEGYSEKTYLDPVGIPTVCYGHTEKSLVVGQEFSFDACHKLLTHDLIVASNAFDRLVKVPVEDNVKAAMVSFIYNVGAENFRKSTMLKLLNDGKIELACHELPRWVYAKGKRLKGLENRRKAEMELCLGTVN